MMNKNILTSGVYAAIAAFFILVILIADQLLDRKNIRERISTLPDLEMKTLDGVTVSLGELSVELPLLLNYFNTQCPFCQHEIAEILVDEQLQEMALLVFISDEPPETVMAFQREMILDQEPELVFLYDENRIIRDYFGIRSVPATYLYTKEGKLIQFYRGVVKTETLRSHFLPNK